MYPPHCSQRCTQMHRMKLLSCSLSLRITATKNASVSDFISGTPGHNYSLLADVPHTILSRLLMLTLVVQPTIRVFTANRGL